jgi:hypothetical protein
MILVRVMAGVMVAVMAMVADMVTPTRMILTSI